MSFGKRFVTKILCHFSFLRRVAIKLKTDHNLLSTKGKVFYDFYMIEERSTEEALNNNASSSRTTLVFHDPYHIPVRCKHSLNKNGNIFHIAYWVTTLHYGLKLTVSKFSNFLLLNPSQIAPTFYSLVEQKIQPGLKHIVL